MTRAELNEFSEKVRRVREAREELETFEAVVYSPVTPSIRESGGLSHSIEVDKLSPVLARHVELKERWLALVVEYVAAEVSISKALDLLTEIERNIVVMRYKKRMRWTEIAEALNYSEKSILRINAQIIEKIAEI